MIVLLALTGSVMAYILAALAHRLWEFRKFMRTLSEEESKCEP